MPENTLVSLRGVSKHFEEGAHQPLKRPQHYLVREATVLIAVFLGARRLIVGRCEYGGGRATVCA
jgi:hypothetical protein